ncbi:hypothetical protein B586_19880 [Mycobacterium haemophilum DSM 44634]|nr:hypothetical protein B586_19880 [Mycobacterium haemophilum DSM 44634]
MYSGPGSDSLWDAWTAWDEVADELSEAALEFQGVVRGLRTASWLGNSSDHMAAAALRISDWIHDTSKRALTTCAQAEAAAKAFDKARKGTVPPQHVDLNRQIRDELVAQNFWNMTTHHITELDVRYHKMWARNTTAMNTYARSAGEALAKLPLFTDPSGFARADPISLKPKKLGEANIPYAYMLDDPTSLKEAADKLMSVGKELKSTNNKEAPKITGVLPPAADAVSQSIAVKLNAQGAQYQAVSTKAATIYQQFVDTLKFSADIYDTTEDTNRRTLGIHSPARRGCEIL